MFISNVNYGNYLCLHLNKKSKAALKSQNYNDTDDTELLQNFYKDHDNKWLGILLPRYTLLLLGVCMKYLKNEEEAKDWVTGGQPAPFHCECGMEANAGQTYRLGLIYAIASGACGAVAGALGKVCFCLISLHSL